MHELAPLLKSPIMDGPMTRRDFLRKLGIGISATVVGAIPDVRESPPPSDITFPPNQLGLNINVRTFGWYNLDYQKALQRLLSLPGEYVRIPIPFDIVAKERNAFNFSSTDRIIDESLKHNKKIALQLGIKTIGWPEVHAPSWLFDIVPNLAQPGTQIDAHEDVRKYVLGYLDHAASRYLGLSEIISIHVENEAFSKNLQVSDYRYLSYEFNKQEKSVVQAHNQYNRPFIQNVPIDTPQAIPYVIRNHDILGLNVYNQAIGNTPEELFWLSINGIYKIAQLLNKSICITEYQSAAWLKEDKTPLHPFSQEGFMDGLRRLQQIDPNVQITFWDLEQILWERNQKRWEEITNLATPNS